MAIRAGELRNRITLQQKVGTPDKYGAEITTWSDVATVWAKVTPVFAKERNAAPLTLPVEQATVVMRWRTGVIEAMRVQHAGKVWQIDGIAPIGANEGLQLSIQRVEV